MANCLTFSNAKEVSDTERSFDVTASTAECRFMTVRQTNIPATTGTQP